MTQRRQSSVASQWGWPIGLAVLTIFGLLSALIGEGGIWWSLSWTALAAPLLVIARHILFPTKRGGFRHARQRAA